MPVFKRIWLIFVINKMITNKLSKEAKKSDVLIEFSDRKELPDSINDFMNICREENMTFKRAPIPCYQVSYYYVSTRKSVFYQDVAMK